MGGDTAMRSEQTSSEYILGNPTDIFTIFSKISETFQNVCSFVDRNHVKMGVGSVKSCTVCTVKQSSSLIVQTTPVIVGEET